MKAIDTIAIITPQTASALRRQGVDAVFVYIGLLNKYHITADRLKVLRDAGFHIGFLYEYGDGAQFSAAIGRTAAIDALSHAKALGIPRGIGIAPAVDYDMQAADYPSLDAHLTAWMSVMRGEYRTGLYAGPGPLQHFRSKVGYIVQPSSWSNGIKLPGIAVWQNSVSTQLCGINVDIDEVYDDSILWKPEGSQKTMFPSIPAQVNQKPYKAIVVGSATHVIWTAWKDLACNLTKVAYGDVEVDGTKPPQVAYAGDTYIRWDALPNVHAVMLPNGAGWEFNASLTEPVTSPDTTGLGTLVAAYKIDVVGDAFYFGEQQPQILNPKTNTWENIGHLQIDTGAATVLLSGAMAGAHGLSGGSSVAGSGVGGSVQGSVVNVSLKVGDTVLTSQPVFVDPTWGAFDDGLWGAHAMTAQGLAMYLNPKTGDLRYYQV